MSSIALTRLAQERKNWRKDYPPGFFARPRKNDDGSTDLMLWECGIPGKAGTDWEGGLFRMEMEFSNDYPASSPLCTFNPPIFHPNIFSNGEVCLSILNHDWSPGITVKQVLLAIQNLLDNANPDSPANTKAYELYVKRRSKYNEEIRKQARKFIDDI